jgi:hypothetical protein
MGICRKGACIMRAFLTLIFILLASSAIANTNNEVMKHCVQTTSDYNKAASCYFDWKNDQIVAERAELRDFLDANPRYRVPGQSNNRCWGKPREMPFESAYIERIGDGFRAGVSYKDTLPAGCYENAPWDNRDD